MFLICFRVFHHDSIRRLVNCLGFGFEPGSDSTLTPVNCWEIQKWGESVELGSGVAVIVIAARTFLVRYVSDVWRCEDKERLVLAFNWNLWREGKVTISGWDIQLVWSRPLSKYCTTSANIAYMSAFSLRVNRRQSRVVFRYILSSSCSSSRISMFAHRSMLSLKSGRQQNNSEITKLNKNVGTELICWILPASGARVRSWSMNCPICMRRWLVVVDIRPSGGGSLSSCSCLLSLRALGSRTASSPLLNLYLIVSYIQTCR